MDLYLKAIFRRIYKVKRRNLRRRRRPTASDKKAYVIYRSAARELVVNRLAYWNAIYGFTWKKIFIRNQITRWGSCSSDKNLNFNFRIVLLPKDLQDYLIVHELCHLGRMDHSADYWKLVEKALPEYRALDERLRAVSIRSIVYRADSGVHPDY